MAGLQSILPRIFPIIILAVGFVLIPKLFKSEPETLGTPSTTKHTVIRIDAPGQTAEELAEDIDDAPYEYAVIHDGYAEFFFAKAYDPDRLRATVITEVSKHSHVSLGGIRHEEGPLPDPPVPEEVEIEDFSLRTNKEGALSVDTKELTEALNSDKGGDTLGGALKTTKKTVKRPIVLIR